MESGITTSVRGLENNKKHSLGERAFIIFFFGRVKFLGLLIAVTIGVWYADRWVPPTYSMWSEYAAHLLLAITVAYFFFVFLETYMEYRYYTYLFTEDA